MGKRILPVLVIGLLCACGGDLDTPEAVIEGTVVAFEDFAKVIEGIDSKEAADSAAGERLAERMAKLAEAHKKLGDVDKSTEAELEQRFKARMMNAMQRIGEAAQTAGPYMAESEKCQQAFQRVGEKIESMG